MGRWLGGGTILLTPITYRNDSMQASGFVRIPCATPANLVIFSGSNDGGLGLAGNGGPAVKQCKLHQCTAKQTQRLSPWTTLTFELTLATVLWNSHSSNQADRNSTSFQSGKRRGINAMTHAGASQACVRAAWLLQAPFNCWRIKSHQRSQTKNLSMMVSWQAW